FINHPAKEESIGLGEALGRVTMQVFVRGDCTMIAAPVQCDVDGISKGSHYVFLKRANDGRAVLGPRATRCPLAVFSCARPGEASEKARWFTGAKPTPSAHPAGVDSGSPGPNSRAASTSATPTSGPTAPASPPRCGCRPRLCAGRAGVSEVGQAPRRGRGRSQVAPRGATWRSATPLV